MSAEEDFESFLRTRNIPNSVIDQLKEEKIDINVICVMTDDELGQYVTRYGDRLAIRAFCRRRTVTNERSGGIQTAKSALMQNIRERLGIERENAVDRGGARGAGNKSAAKVTRRVEMGWLHFQNGSFHQIRARGGGGTRHLAVDKSVTMAEMLETGKGLFFPNGHSSKGPIEDFHFGVRDYSHNVVSLDVTVGQLYEERKMGMLRVYMTSKAKTILLSDVSSDIETPDEQPQKRRSLRKRSQRHQHRRTRINQVDNPERSSDLDPAPSSSMQRGELMDRSRPASLEMSDTEEALHPPSSDELGQLTDRHGPEHRLRMMKYNLDRLVAMMTTKTPLSHGMHLS
ncbi:uncharacterized protein LOC144013536 isoform X2 [Festucalex cinctus]